MRLPVDCALPLAALIFLTGCGSGDRPVASAPTFTPAGPAADYPMVIGDPFVINGVVYTPEDKLSYDAVGYATVGESGGDAITAAHRTLPLPSYVEITSLDSGKTILLRIERRGPMAGDTMIELSPGAAEQLGLTAEKAPVRVRRVNPPEIERATLRTGGRVPERMETPKGLLAVLMRKLAPQVEAKTEVPSAPSPAVSATPPATRSPEPSPSPAPPAKQSAVIASKREESGTFVVQAATFSTETRAKAAAAGLHGKVAKAGSFWRLWLGPFPTRADAQRALVKAKSAGYSDARIQRGG